MKLKVLTKLPGPKSSKILGKLIRFNAGYSNPYPFVHSQEGRGVFFKDLDGNTFLDFSSQIASNPLGYNHPELKQVVKKYSTRHPIKFAGQDFSIKEHVDLLEELFSITPAGLNTAFFSNSGAEAVENCLKIALRNQKQAKFGISFKSAFHGRTLGALSCTNSKQIQKKHFFSLPIKRINFNENAVEELERILKQEANAKEIGFIIIESIQGEGGYNVAGKKLIKSLHAFAKSQGIPLIADEVQSGMGRTGKWWAVQHYNIKPDIMSSAKALQVGASITSKKFVPEAGSISSTWGGGSILDLALGLKTIQVIKKKKLLLRVQRNGNYLIKRLKEIQLIDSNPKIHNIRGRGLMLAFDLHSKKIRNNFIIECLKKGLVLLGCSELGVRLIPPFIISQEEIDQAIDIMEKAVLKTSKTSFKHKGGICKYLNCPEVHT